MPGDTMLSVMKPASITQHLPPHTWSGREGFKARALSQFGVVACAARHSLWKAHPELDRCPNVLTLRGANCWLALEVWMNVLAESGLDVEEVPDPSTHADADSGREPEREA